VDASEWIRTLATARRSVVASSRQTQDVPIATLDPAEWLRALAASRRAVVASSIQAQDVPISNPVDAAEWLRALATARHAVVAYSRQAQDVPISTPVDAAEWLRALATARRAVVASVGQAQDVPISTPVDAAEWLRALSTARRAVVASSSHAQDVPISALDPAEWLRALATARREVVSSSNRAQDTPIYNPVDAAEWLRALATARREVAASSSRSHDAAIDVGAADAWMKVISMIKRTPRTHSAADAPNADADAYQASRWLLSFASSIPNVYRTLDETEQYIRRQQRLLSQGRSVYDIQQPRMDRVSRKIRATIHGLRVSGMQWHPFHQTWKDIADLRWSDSMYDIVEVARKSSHPIARYLIDRLISDKLIHESVVSPDTHDLVSEFFETQFPGYNPASSYPFYAALCDKWASRADAVIEDRMRDPLTPEVARRAMQSFQFHVLSTIENPPPELTIDDAAALPALREADDVMHHVYKHALVRSLNATAISFAP
jgi:hypothetical protein